MVGGAMNRYFKSIGIFPYLYDKYNELGLSEEINKADGVKLIMIDSHLPFGRRMRMRESYILKQFVKDICDQFDSLVVVDGICRANKKLFTIILERFKQLEVFPKEYELEAFINLYQIYKTNLKAMLRYKPMLIQGEIHHIVAKDSIDQSSALYWQGFAEEIKSYIILGDHYSILVGDHVELLANKIKQIL